MSETLIEKTDSLIVPRCREALAALIEEHGGNEVFAIGTCGASGAVEELDPIAFGNWNSVPAPAQEATSGQVLIHNHPSGGLSPSDNDISIASMYGKAGLGFYIVDNACQNIRVVVKPFREKQLARLDVDSLAATFGPEGLLSSSMQGFEFRPQQLEMVQMVARAFNEDRIAVVEAGTGTGKSFAYLAPAIMWATANKQRVVISTNTINLQEQLLKKDLPELKERLRLEFKAVLVKGRSNYISLRRLKLAVQQLDLIPDVRSSEIKQLDSWAKKTADGSRSDLGQIISDETWEAVSSDKDDCLRARCPHFDDCLFYKSRREAASADVIIANHHLVMADVALKRDATGSDFMSVLPPFERVIFDEAHHLEEVATEYFSSDTSQLAMHRQLLKLHGRSESRGALPRLYQSVTQADHSMLYPPTSQLVKLLQHDLPLGIMETDSAVSQAFDGVFYKAIIHFALPKLAQRERKELRMTELVRESAFWQDLVTQVGDASAALRSLLENLRKAIQLLKFYPEEIVHELLDSRTAVVACETKLREHLGAMEFFLKASDEEFCRWIELRYWRDRPLLRICTAPLDMAPRLRSALFARKRTSVLASATLTIENSFDFVARQLGVCDLELPDDETT